ncbi:hypothetical protein FRB97_008717 [Tulasnella sp. 331]|nr:hypothetical protein FRB97_008717 [Tulasnella sp. 331]
MALVDAHAHPPGLSNIVQRLESFISKCQQTIQILTSSSIGLSSSDATFMLRGFCNADVALADLEKQAAETRETIGMIHQTTPYPRFVDKLSEDILSYIFRLATQEVMPDDVPVGDEYYDDCHEGDDEDIPPPPLRFPEQIVQVSRRWRTVGLGAALIWTRIVADPKHPPERMARWLRLSQQAPLSVHWARQAAELHVLMPHISRIKSLDLVIPAEEAFFVTINLLLPTAATKQHALLRLALSTSGRNYRGAHIDHREWTSNSNELFSSIRHFSSKSVLLTWSWPIRNLLSLHLESLDLEWPKLRDVLASSPDLERLTLHDLHIADLPPNGRNQTITALPVFHHLEVLEILELHFLWYPRHSQPSILQAIRAPALVKLAVYGEWNAQEAIMSLLSASPFLEDVGLGLTEEQPRLDDMLAALTKTPPLHLKTLAITNPSRRYIGDQAHIVDISDASMYALRKCTELSNLKLGGLDWHIEGLIAMVSARKGPDLGVSGLGSGLTYFQTSRHLGDEKAELERLGVVVVDDLPSDADEWDGRFE